MNIIDQIRESWGWAGITPAEVVRENDFGNFIVRDLAGKYWRICPEECSCEVIAPGEPELAALYSDPVFEEDWYMERLLESARQLLGELPFGRKYCLKIPGVLGGNYEIENVATAPVSELLDSSASVAKQIKGLPDGTTVKLKVT